MTPSTKTMLDLLFALILASCVHSQVVPGNCTTLSTDKFTFLDMAKRPFCFKFNNGVTGPLGPPPDGYGMYKGTVFYYFGTQVDQYSLIQLQNSNLDDGAGETWLQDQPVQVEVEAGGLTSEPMYARKYIGDELWIFTQLSLVIVLEEGSISELIWDEGCYGCDDAHCIDNNCAIKQSECTNENECDFMAYISWYGTDTNQRYLLSAGQRLSQFSSLSAEYYYDYVKDQLSTDWVDFSRR